MNNILRNKEFKCGLEKSQAMPKIRMTLGKSIAIRITAKAYMWECKTTKDPQTPDQTNKQFKWATPERIWPNCNSVSNADFFAQRL
jgi:hypothetical protein